MILLAPLSFMLLQIKRLLAKELRFLNIVNKGVVSIPRITDY